MSPEAQRFLIAGAMGLVIGRELGYSDGQANEIFRPDPNGTWHDLATWKKKYDWVQNFDPLNDLNVMHEAEKVLTVEQASTYGSELAKIAGRGVEFHEDTQIGPLDVFVWASFTAPQRSESFLRTLGLWTDA